MQGRSVAILSDERIRVTRFIRSNVVLIERHLRPGTFIIQSSQTPNVGATRRRHA